MSDKWTTNDGDFTNDIVTIKVNGTTWDVADTYARSQLLLKIDAPEVAGTAGQVLSLTAGGTAWINPPSGGSATYTEGNGIDISEDNKINIKGVDVYDGVQVGMSGLYIDDTGLNCGVADFVTRFDFTEALGDINSILDEINGEEV